MAGAGSIGTLGAEDFESWRRLVEAWSSYAAGLFDYHDFGFEAREFLGHAADVAGDLARMRDESAMAGARLWPADADGRSRIAQAVRPWNPAKSLGYLAGASFLIQPFRPGFPPESIRLAFASKVFYQCIQDILDDLVDRLGCAYPAAQEMYELAFSPMIGEAVDVADLRLRLAELVPRGGEAAVDRLCESVAGLHAILRGARNTEAVSEFDRLNEWIVLGQPTAALQRSPHRDLGQVRSIASGLWAPSADLRWQERYGGHLSWPLQHSMLDNAFAAEPLSGSALAAHREAWYYFHAVLTNLNHLVAVREDLRDGIVNVALLTLRERELFGGREPESVADLTVADHEAMFARTAGLTRRALDRAADAYEDPRHFNASIAILVGVVAMASKIGREDEMIHAYMRWLAPVVREAVRGP